MKKKSVYFFGKNSTDGSAGDKEFLGGKGANLAEMTKLGVPVPPGFTISTDVCVEYYDNNRQLPDAVNAEIQENMQKLEVAMGKEFGSSTNPLLVSVRSGAAVSMPGMMDTILNLGINDNTVKGVAIRSGSVRLAWDAYRRFLTMFGNVVLNIEHEHFESELTDLKKKKGVKEDTYLDAEDLQQLVKKYKEIILRQSGKEFPESPEEQLRQAIQAVFSSWNNERAIKYRKINSIEVLKGTAVNVQAMVFGNRGEHSGTGVCFSRDASTGENVFYGEYLQNAQGEDVVAGIRTPQPLLFLKEGNPEIYAELTNIKDQLELHYRDMQDIEFTVEEKKLYILQTRNAKRTGPAAVRVAVEMVKEGLISKEEALLRVSANQLDQLFHPMVDAAAKKQHTPVAKGLNASPGAASGMIVFSAADAEKWVAEGKKVLLVRNETSPEDIGGMNVAEGILTATGGMTSHAAVVARGMGRPCVAGCRMIHISKKIMRVGDREYQEGAYFTIDGNTGEVFDQLLDLIPPRMNENIGEFLEWADEIRHNTPRKGYKVFGVRTNADTPEQAQISRKLGAEGIGLCRTEHMFFGEERIQSFRKMIIADTVEQRKKALEELLPLQRRDFYGIFKAMEGYPVTIRLFDPPLHEFLPTDPQLIEELARAVSISVAQLKGKIAALHELNPMLGHRGCRLGITYPEVYDMQVRAIIQASCDLKEQGATVEPEIMIPLVGVEPELRILVQRVHEIAKEVFTQRGMSFSYKTGTMIEIPRAALTANEMAQHAEFFSFGTNDLTQLTFGYSRDDINSFLPHYLEQGILKVDPFQSLDQSGVGQLIEFAVEKGRKVNASLKIGICGEHGGDVSSIEFCYRNNFNYISCSSLRIPQARLGAAQSVLRS